MNSKSDSKIMAFIEVYQKQRQAKSKFKPFTKKSRKNTKLKKQTL